MIVSVSLLVHDPPDSTRHCVITCGLPSPSTVIVFLPRPELAGGITALRLPEESYS